VCHFDAASGLFKCHFGALMWLCSTGLKGHIKSPKEHSVIGVSMDHHNELVCTWHLDACTRSTVNHLNVVYSVTLL